MEGEITFACVRRAVVLEKVQMDAVSYQLHYRRVQQMDNFAYLILSLSSACISSGLGHLWK